MIEWAAIIAGAALVGGVGVWGLRLEGLVNLHKQRVDDLKELINEKFASTDGRLERIERKIDANGKY